MAKTRRSLVALSALLLVLPAGPASAQDGGSIADVLEALAREIGATAEATQELLDAIDPTDPDAPIDPTDPDAPIDPTDPDAPIDPTVPDAPIDPEPADPGDPASPASPDTPAGPELPEPAPEGPGGFAEIQLLPDPAPRAGRYRVTNGKGIVVCRRAGQLPLKKTTVRGRIRVRDDGRVLRGSGLGGDRGAPVTMTWDPETERYVGRVTAREGGGTTTLDFVLRVVSPTKMKGEMIAVTEVSAGGFAERCTASRPLTLKRTGG